MLTPRILLHFEGLAVLVLSLGLFARTDGSWLWFAVLFLSPDVFMAGYLFNPRVGAVAYNLLHTNLGPIAMLGVLWLVGREDLVWLALIWMAHIGMDRLLGFGLKFETAFKDTHLQKV